MIEKLKAKGLEYISPDQIDRNPQNPRLIFDEKLMRELKESINELGILVPLIVYYDDEKNKYILLDGERRWKCAIDLKLKKVPTNIIAKPTKLQNILEMFNIHNVRIEWGAMEIAWKLKIIIEEFGYTTEKDLSRITSLKPLEIRKSKTLLSYDKKYQNLVHLGPKNQGIKEDFLIELNPTLNWIEKNLDFSKEEKNRLIDSLIGKHKDKLIKNYVTDFRNLSKIVRSDMPQKRVHEIINRLMKEGNYTIEDAYETSVKYSLNLQDIERKSKRLIKILKDFKFDSNNEGNKELIKTLEELKQIILKILDKLKK